MTSVGINVGALAVKVVVVGDGGRRARVAPHLGRPQEALDRILAGLDAAPRGGDPLTWAVSGHLGSLSEVAAIERALGELHAGFDAVASLGGEAFLLYLVDGRRVRTVLSHNKCAAGSGEFLVQQVGRLGLDLDRAIDLAGRGHPVPLASRCSVHCKSDITHKLNRGEARPEDILRSLHDAMADKVVALLDQGRAEPSRLLVIGGVARNRALVAALRARLARTAVVVLEESPWLEAWGTALVAADQPRVEAWPPRLAVRPRAGHLAPLGDGVRARLLAEPPAAPKTATAPAAAAPLALGVDAGSTTTKAVLVDGATGAIVAGHYRRTDGDPVAAARACLEALRAAHGDVVVAPVGATGSGREMVAAWLGTGHVYNEISAHAAGAAHFDRDVDTIFEIGGQDAKYIHLRNGVPIDYAMNNACAAGTGSFLEESAHGDLGIDVADIGRIALAAPAPVPCKATCAAFINSDIRIALQEGRGRDDIVAGLVYAVAHNYLSKVKGHRRVGRRVFLQGGVALNPALAPAFARVLDREVIVPPRPELLGALGVALLAVDRDRGDPRPARRLSELASATMVRARGFTCGACELHCPIERFVVAGRRFPFGGRCSLFESVWKQGRRRPPVEDLVEERSRIVFAPPPPPGRPRRPRVGIARALAAHTLHPLYATFLAALGLEVVLGDVDPTGADKAQSGFCFPAQLAHGAVVDLARCVDLVFLPHLSHMPKLAGSRDSCLCPIAQASPYFLRQALPGVRLLAPHLDFGDGYEASTALIELAQAELGATAAEARAAWDQAIAAQRSAERALHDLGRRALADAAWSAEPAVVLVGRSYNAYWPRGSQSVARKLASMGVRVIPGDCLEPSRPGAMAWHFSNQILDAVEVVKRHRNLYLLYVTNFSCTVDAFTEARVGAELGDRPWLTLEIDSHTADAGIQTRLEAFLDIIAHHRAADRPPAARFTPCRVDGDGQVVTTSGERLSLHDRRVKLFLPTFSSWHSRAWTLAARWLGVDGRWLELDRRQLERGLAHTSGRECVPLPICIGQILEARERLRPGEVAGFYMLRGGAPCVVDSYLDYLDRFLAEQRIDDVFLLDPRADNRWCGLDPQRLLRYLAASVAVADLLVEVEHALHVVSGPAGVARLERLGQELLARAASPRDLERRLEPLAAELAALPGAGAARNCPRVAVTGDFFTRFSPFFMEGVREHYAERGILLEPVALNDLILYAIYAGLHGEAARWGLTPSPRATLKACSRLFHDDGRAYLARRLGLRMFEAVAGRYRRCLAPSGLVGSGQSDPGRLFDLARRHISPAIWGESLPTVGKGLAAAAEGYAGVLVVGPFNCLPYRISEAILKPLSRERGIPFLSYESDGYAVAPAFLRLVDVHIEQVLDRAAAPAG